MTRARPSKHYRNIKTKKGIKKVLVNPSIRKRKPKSIAKIKINERKIFTHLSSPRNHRFEFGGAIDFQRDGSIENIQVIPGTNFEVNLPSEDYEVMYHTHPASGVSLPTGDDIIALLRDSKQQAEIVFREGTSFVIIKTPATKKLLRLSNKQINDLIRLFHYEIKGQTKQEEKFKKKLEKLGFIVKYNKKLNTPINIPIKIIQ